MGTGGQADFWQVELAWVFVPAKNMNVRAVYSVSESTPKTRPNESSLEAKLNSRSSASAFRSDYRRPVRFRTDSTL